MPPRVRGAQSLVASAEFSKGLVPWHDFCLVINAANASGCLSVRDASNAPGRFN